MQYAWTKQAAIYIVCTHAYVCVSDLYYSVSTTLRRYYTLFYCHFSEYPVSFTVILALEFAMKRLQCCDTKIKISDEVLMGHSMSNHPMVETVPPPPPDFDEILHIWSIWSEKKICQILA